ncbi:hypothetical protein [Flavobacterium sp. J27]|uniref:hypothetical protein n=1 Tax=Flavobacterium sp. J27 TaxID=2060419 RepID=UPI0013EE8FE1|nr:hypothetical protein [Flavobacterium sp. J27]
MGRIQKPIVIIQKRMGMIQKLIVIIQKPIVIIQKRRGRIQKPIVIIQKRMGRIQKRRVTFQKSFAKKQKQIESNLTKNTFFISFFQPQHSDYFTQNAFLNRYLKLKNRRIIH